MSRLGAIALSVDLTPERYDWRDHGLCKARPDLNFFPERGEATRAAKALCAVCPVREVCLQVALTNGEKFGIWGGTSERERRRMRKAQGIRQATTSELIVAELQRQGGTWWADLEQIGAHIERGPSSTYKAVVDLEAAGTVAVTRQASAGSPRIVAIHLTEGPTP